MEKVISEIDKDTLAWVVWDAVGRIGGSTDDFAFFAEVYHKVEHAKLIRMHRLIIPSFDTNAPKQTMSDADKAALIASVLYDEEMYWKSVMEDIVLDHKKEILS
jgi:hypothetical protein